MKKILVFIVCALMVTACRTAYKHQQLPVKLPTSFSIAGEVELQKKWWQAFADPHLNRLVNLALQNNLSLLSMWDRIDQACATAQKAGADLYPWLSAKLGYKRTDYTTSTTGTNLYTVGASISYELDLWGRIGAERRAKLLNVSASQQDLQAAAITLVANIAENWYQLIEQYRQLEIIKQQIKTNQQNLELIELRFRRGQVPITDVLQQRQTVKNNNSERIIVERDIEILRHQLAILCGLPPRAITLPTDATFPKLMALPQTGTIAKWLKRRPDLQKAYFDLQAADENVVAAVANLYPRIGLSVDLDSTVTELRDWFSNWMAAFAANLTAPIFEAGQRHAEIDRVEALAAEKFHNYGDKVLSAMKEVEDALVKAIKQRQYIQSLNERLKISAQVLRQTQDRYIYAQQDFLRYLDALLRYQQLQRQYLTAERSAISYRIQLYKALAGSWKLVRPQSKKKHNNSRR